MPAMYRGACAEAIEAGLPNRGCCVSCHADAADGYDELSDRESPDGRHYFVGCCSTLRAYDELTEDEVTVFWEKMHDIDERTYNT